MKFKKLVCHIYFIYYLSLFIRVAVSNLLFVTNRNLKVKMNMNEGYIRFLSLGSDFIYQNSSSCTQKLILYNKAESIGKL